MLWPPLRESPSRPRRVLTCALGDEQTPAWKAPRNTKLRACLSRPVRGARGRACASFETKTTLGNGYLGSRIDEERSEMRYLV